MSTSATNTASQRHPLRRVGAVGDVHGAEQELATALKFLRQEGVEQLVSVGDIVDGPGNVAACIQLLQEHEVLTIRGNHDRWFLEGSMRSLPDATLELPEAERAFLETLPVTQRLNTTAGDLLVCHGIDREDMVGLRPETRGYDLRIIADQLRGEPETFSKGLFGILAGHTHQRMVRKLEPFWFFNAGTLLSDQQPGCLLLDFELRTATFYDLDGPAFPSRAATFNL